MSNPKKRAAADGDAAPSSKNAKKKKSKANNSQDDETLDTELGLNTVFARLDSQLLADYLAQKTTRFGSDLSPVEIADLALPAGCIRDASSWRSERTLSNLPNFIEKFSEDKESLRKPPTAKGAPHTLIVAGAGLRAADLVRAVRKFQGKDNAVAKLFAKHMKVDEQVSFLKNKKTGIGVGTPARLTELIDNGALNLDSLQRLIVDASHIDQKKRGIMDMKDTMMPLAQFLTRKEFTERYVDEKKPLSLLFY